MLRVLCYPHTRTARCGPTKSESIRCDGRCVSSRRLQPRGAMLRVSARRLDESIIASHYCARPAPCCSARVASAAEAAPVRRSDRARLEGLRRCFAREHHRVVEGFGPRGAPCARPVLDARVRRRVDGADARPALPPMDVAPLRYCISHPQQCPSRCLGVSTPCEPSGCSVCSCSEYPTSLGARPAIKRRQLDTCQTILVWPAVTHSRSWRQ